MFIAIYAYTEECARDAWKVLLRLAKMIYDSVLGRSFSKQEQKKLGYWAFVACLFIALSFFTNFKPFLGPLSVCKSFIIQSDIYTWCYPSLTYMDLAVNLRLSMGEDEKLHLFSDTDSSLLIANGKLWSTKMFWS